MCLKSGTVERVVVRERKLQSTTEEERRRRWDGKKKVAAVEWRRKWRRRLCKVRRNRRSLLERRWWRYHAAFSQFSGGNMGIARSKRKRERDFTAILIYREGIEMEEEGGSKGCLYRERKFWRETN